MMNSWCNPAHHCTDTASDLRSPRLQLKQMGFSTTNLACSETGWYLTVVQMVWLIAQRRQESFMSHAVIDREDKSDTEPWVCDGLIQKHIAIKQHCIGGSWYTLFTWWWHNTKAYSNKTALHRRELIYLIYMVWWPLHMYIYSINKRCPYSKTSTWNQLPTIG